MAEPLEELRRVRLEKLKRIRELGVDPYPSSFELRESIDFARKKGLKETARTAGRLIGWRSHGKIIFGDLRDESGQIQVLFKKDLFSGEKLELIDLLDIGDFLGVIGELFQTKAGELTIEVFDYTLLSKSIRPLPSLHFGLKDEEERLRQRYVDLTLEPLGRDLFIRKAVFWQTMRSFLIGRSFLEVETPVLEVIAGGADAEPFITHHNALDIDVYLRISMGELWQKRLMVGGFEKTFEIGRQFRNEGLSREHLQDYTQMEFYWAYADYRDGMALVEELYKEIAKKTFGTLKFTVGGHQIDLEPKWGTIDYETVIEEKLGINILTAAEADLKKKLKELGVSPEVHNSRRHLVDLLWKQVRSSISGPVFLTGHPVEVSPLAKRDPADSRKVQRYQVIIAGSEMGNGYSELNDPLDQAERFGEQQRLRETGDAEAQMFDHDFVRALEYGMPPVTGFGVSERLFAFLANKSVREAVLFPLLKPEAVLSA